jgi:uncharacterized cupin superfamily protein
MADTKQIKVVKTNDVPWAAGMTRGRYENQRKELGGLDVLRSGLWQLAPGKKSFPLHRHNVTEEAMFVLSGHAMVRTPEGDTAVGPGDYVAFPPRGPAHQLVNDGSEPFVYLGLSANPAGVDVVEYPDSGKVAASTGAPPTGKRMVFREAGQVDYFDGDPDA